MKKITLLAIITLFAVFKIQAQTDTIYFIKDGQVVNKYNVVTDLDSIIFYNPVSEVEEPEEPSGTFTDKRDGNQYKYVTIGEQVWMAENLKYLPAVFPLEEGTDKAPRYYVFGYEGSDTAVAKATDNYKTYGVLYNWPAAMAGAAGSNTNPSNVQGACPDGWHLPSHSEWQELTDYAGGLANAGAKLKEKGTEHWKAPNTGATDEFGFAALAGGFRNPDTSLYLTEYGYWWTATEIDEENAYRRYMLYNKREVVEANGIKQNGFSIRCVKNY